MSSTNFLLLLDQKKRKKSSTPKKIFQGILKSHNEKMQFKELTFNELEKAFKIKSETNLQALITVVGTPLLVHIIALKIFCSMFSRYLFSKEYFLIA